MKPFLFKLALRFIKFFHLERKIPQLRQTDVRDLKPNRIYYHYGRTIVSYKNPEKHYCKYRVLLGDKSYDTSDLATVERARSNGALIEEVHCNLPCHLCDIKAHGLPCCVCSMDVYFRIIDELKQYGCT